MSDDLKDLFKINEISEMEFKEKYGFTFAFERRIIFINGQVTSAEIRPLGIIYKEKDEYYFAPLDKVKDINAIIKEFVEKK